MPQFDQYVIGVLLVTTFVVFGVLHFLFLTQILVPVKMAIGMRERLISLIKKGKNDANKASTFCQAGSFYDEYVEFKEQAQKKK
jgi:5-bromo-4-chloroindolyl phosphate hydrolysis protein